MVGVFWISPSLQSVSPDFPIATYTVTITGLGGFNLPVTLSGSGLPAGAACSFSPNPAPLGTAALTLSTSTATPAGTVTFTVTGTSGSLTHSATAGLTVTAPVVTLGTLNVGTGQGAPGGMARVPISLSLNLTEDLLSLAWLEGLRAAAGEPLLLGYVEVPDAAASLTVFGASANAQQDGRDVSLSFLSVVRLRSEGQLQ